MRYLLYRIAPRRIAMRYFFWAIVENPCPPDSESLTAALHRKEIEIHKVSLGLLLLELQQNLSLTVCVVLSSLVPQEVFP